jgi:hypothetical protein
MSDQEKRIDLWSHIQFLYNDSDTDSFRISVTLPQRRDLIILFDTDPFHALSNGDLDTQQLVNDSSDIDAVVSIYSRDPVSVTKAVDPACYDTCIQSIQKALSHFLHIENTDKKKDKKSTSQRATPYTKAQQEEILERIKPFPLLCEQLSAELIHAMTGPDQIRQNISHLEWELSDEKYDQDIHIIKEFNKIVDMKKMALVHAKKNLRRLDNDIVSKRWEILDISKHKEFILGLSSTDATILESIHEAYISSYEKLLFHEHDLDHSLAYKGPVTEYLESEYTNQEAETAVKQIYTIHNAKISAMGDTIRHMYDTWRSSKKLAIDYTIKDIEVGTKKQAMKTISDIVWLLQEYAKLAYDRSNTDNALEVVYEEKRRTIRSRIKILRMQWDTLTSHDLEDIDTIEKIVEDITDLDVTNKNIFSQIDIVISPQDEEILHKNKQSIHTYSQELSDISDRIHQQNKTLTKLHSTILGKKNVYIKKSDQQVQDIVNYFNTRLQSTEEHDIKELTQLTKKELRKLRVLRNYQEKKSNVSTEIDDICFEIDNLIGSNKTYEDLIRYNGLESTQEHIDSDFPIDTAYETNYWDIVRYTVASAQKLVDIALYIDDVCSSPYMQDKLACEKEKIWQYSEKILRYSSLITRICEKIKSFHKNMKTHPILQDTAILHENNYASTKKSLIQHLKDIHKRRSKKSLS